MNHKTFRVLLSLVLVCVLLVSWSPIRARAVVAGAAAVVKSSVVTGNPYIVVGAILIALGIQAGVESGAFEAVVNGAVDALDAAGGWIQDGAMQLFKTVDAAGEVVYYAAGDLFETLRSWAFDSAVVRSAVPVVNSAVVGTVAYHPTIGSNDSVYNHSYMVLEATAPIYQFNLCSNYHCTVFCSTAGFKLQTESGGTVDATYKSVNGVRFYITHNMLRTSDTVGAHCVPYRYGITSALLESICAEIIGTGFCSRVFTYDDIRLGYVSNTAIDYNLYPDAYSDYMRSQLRVINTGGGGDSGNDGDQNWKWYLPLSLAATLAAIAATDQEQQWTGQTSEEFPENSTVTKFEILDTPEIDGYLGLEVSPSTDPNPDSGSDPGTDTDPDTGTDTDGSLSNTPWENFKKWISTGWESIIQAIPTPGSIAEAVGNVIKSIFVPDADFISEKWNDIRSRFEFADSITATGEVLVNILDGLDPEPPVIYIDLGAAEGSYDIGGEVPFVDLCWYARYKPTMDLIISAFLWLAFVWRLILKLPGIISGMPGEFVLMNLPVNLPHLGIGSGQRREELESGRNNRRLGDGH